MSSQAEADISAKKWMRLVSLIIGLLMEAASFFTSVSGFGFIMPNYVAVGFLMGIVLILAEFNFLDEGSQGSIGVVSFGLFAYAYGIFTNVLGFWIGGGGGMVQDNPMRFALCVVIGFVLEVFAEPAVMKGLGMTPTSVLDVIVNFGK